MHLVPLVPFCLLINGSQALRYVRVRRCEGTVNDDLYLCTLLYRCVQCWNVEAERVCCATNAQQDLALCLEIC